MRPSACEKGQKPQQALHLLQDLQLRGLLPDVITYSAAISAREKGQQPQQALHLLQELQLRGLLPKVNTYSAAISACENLVTPCTAGHGECHMLRCPGLVVVGGSW